ncbi:MAG: SMP-30/gluconolactonase/LRE family protein [Mesorhizobium sp.]|nr:SMP-30/gluconolactonase/LRE family protein [Mesorhizobium sp.]MBN9245531.1 SMP-30/gluconolactonase/LRE family protein [Mesorhizobium sp.]
MFAAPPEIKTRVFARIPDHYRVSGRRSTWVEAQRGGQPTDCFLEGPSFDRQGNLYVVDVPWGRIFRIRPSGEVDLACEYDGEPNGLKIHRDGRIFIADFKRGILELDIASGSITVVVDRMGVEHFKGVNDLFFVRNGDLYFTDQGHSGLHDASGRVFRLSAAGELEIVLQNIPSPNGLAFGPDEGTLFVNVTRDNAVWRVPLLDRRQPYKVGAFIRLSGGTGPDGLALDEDGGLAVAHIGLGCVWLFDRHGEPTARIRSCAGRAITNIAFGGPGRRRLFMTEGDSGQVLVADVPVAGAPLFSHL